MCITSRHDRKKVIVFDDEANRPRRKFFRRLTRAVASHRLNTWSRKNRSIPITDLLLVEWLAIAEEQGFPAVEIARFRQAVALERPMLVLECVEVS